MTATTTKTTTIATSIGLLLTIAAPRAHPADQGPPAPPKASVPAAGVTVPMRDYGGRPVISVKLNGKGPIDFVLDTGAAGGALDPDAAAALGITAASGVMSIDTLTIGAVKLTGVTLRASTFMRGLGPGAPSGVMSASWFPAALVTFDFPKKTLTIKPGALPAANGKTIFDCDPSSFLPTIPVSVAGKTYAIHLDTGAPGGVMLPMAASKDVPLASPLADAPSARTQAGEFEVKTATVKGGIAIGQFTIDAGPVRFSDLRPGPGPAPGNIGSAAFKTFALTYDSANRRFRLARAAR